MGVWEEFDARSVDAHCLLIVFLTAQGVSQHHPALEAKIVHLNSFFEVIFGLVEILHQVLIHSEQVVGDEVIWVVF